MNSDDVTRVQLDTLRTLADHFDAMRRAGGSPQLDNALWHAASFTREQMTYLGAGTPNIFAAGPSPLVPQSFKDAVAKTAAERYPDKYGAPA
jgi:hypothetical protein